MNKSFLCYLFGGLEGKRASCNVGVKLEQSKNESLCIDRAPEAAEQMLANFSVCHFILIYLVEVNLFYVAIFPSSGFSPSAPSTTHFPVRHSSIALSLAVRSLGIFMKLDIKQ